MQPFASKFFFFPHNIFKGEKQRFIQVTVYIMVCAGPRCSVMSSSLQPHGLQPTRLLCPQGFSRGEYWSRWPCPPDHLPSRGIESKSPTLQADSLLSEPLGKPPYHGLFLLNSGQHSVVWIYCTTVGLMIHQLKDIWVVSALTVMNKTARNTCGQCFV